MAILRGLFATPTQHTGRSSCDHDPAVRCSNECKNPKTQPPPLPPRHPSQMPQPIVGIPTPSSTPIPPSAKSSTTDAPKQANSISNAEDLDKQTPQTSDGSGKKRKGKKANNDDTKRSPELPTSSSQPPAPPSPPKPSKKPGSSKPTDHLRVPSQPSSPEVTTSIPPTPTPPKNESTKVAKNAGKVPAIKPIPGSSKAAPVAGRVPAQEGKPRNRARKDSPYEEGQSSEIPPSIRPTSPPPRSPARQVQKKAGVKVDKGKGAMAPTSGRQNTTAVKDQHEAAHPLHAALVPFKAPPSDPPPSQFPPFTTTGAPGMQPKLWLIAYYLMQGLMRGGNNDPIPPIPPQFTLEPMDTISDITMLNQALDDVIDNQILELQLQRQGTSQRKHQGFHRDARRKPPVPRFRVDRCGSIPPPPSPLKSKRPDILYRVETPYNAEAFHKAISNDPELVKLYPDLVSKLVHGFPMGSFPPNGPTKTRVTPNGQGAFKHTDFVDNEFREEVESGRMSGPYSEAHVKEILGGEFICSPITVRSQEQEGKPEPKLRMCIDLSRTFKDMPSVNDHSTMDEFPADFDGCERCAEIIRDAVRGTQAATLDISKFYRRTPIAIAHKRWFVMMSRRGRFYIQHCCPFGARPSGGNSGQISDCVVSIWQKRNVGPVVKWCDDFAMFRYPNGGDGTPQNPWKYGYTKQSALKLIEELNVPWHAEKGQDFASTFTYVGLEWDIENKMVVLPEQKKSKMLQQVEALLSNGSSSLQVIQSTAGFLQYCGYVVPRCRSYLASFPKFIKEFGDGHSPKVLHLPADVKDDLRWWRELLSQPTLSRSLINPPLPAHDIRVYSSLKWGIGITYGERWSAWRLEPPTWGETLGITTNYRDHAWLDAIGVELAVYLLVHSGSGLRDTCIRVSCSNQEYYQAYMKGKSHKVEVNLAIRRTVEALERADMSMVLLEPDNVVSKAVEALLAYQLAIGQDGPAAGREALRCDLPPEVAAYVKEVELVVD